MNEDITDLLIAHEVGHALFTPQSGWEESIVKRKIPKSFLNVLEDARIEKLIKRKYPGLSQSFIKGYRDLINNIMFIDYFIYHSYCYSLYEILRLAFNKQLFNDQPIIATFMTIYYHLLTINSLYSDLNYFNTIFICS